MKSNFSKNGIEIHVYFCSISQHELPHFFKSNSLDKWWQFLGQSARSYSTVALLHTEILNKNARD